MSKFVSTYDFKEDNKQSNMLVNAYDKYENLHFFGKNSNYQHQNDNMSFKDNKKSPLLTPGRKSASPTFFCQNDLVNNGMNYLKNLPQEKYFLNLKIPTTPTRSKSLSPSLRPIIQPLRLRHKQNDCKKSYSKINENSATQNINNFGEGQVHNFSSVNSAFESYLNLKQKSSIENTNFSRFNNSIDESRSDFSSDYSVKSIDSDQYVNNYPIQYDDEIKQETKTLEQSAQKKNLIKFRLPFNVRMLNLKNFPETSELSPKRKISIPLIKMKNSHAKNLEKNLDILEENIQFIINDKLKKLMDDCKDELIEPAINNIRLNYGKESMADKDIMCFVLKLINKAKDQFENSELLNNNQKFEITNDKLDILNSECDLISTNNYSLSKRKLSEESIDAAKVDNQIKKIKKM